MSKERLEEVKNREFIENIKNYSIFEHMREGFVVPKETYLRLVEMAENFVALNSQYDTCIKIQEELIEEKQQNKRYREAIENAQVAIQKNLSRWNYKDEIALHDVWIHNKELLESESE